MASAGTLMTDTLSTSPLTAATCATKNTGHQIVFKIIYMCTTKEKERAEENNGRLECPHCHKLLKGTSLRKHLEDMHTVHLTTYECKMCHRHYRTPNSLQNHCSRYHRRQRPDPEPHNLSSLLVAAASARAVHVSPGHASPRTPGLSNGKTSILYTPAECPLCKRRFFNKYSAKRHMIQAHGENRFHTRPYARADPSCVSATFSAALQAMGVGSSEVGPALAKAQSYQQTMGMSSSEVGPQSYQQEACVFPPATSPRHQGYRDVSYPQVTPGPSPPRNAPQDTAGYLAARYSPHDLKPAPATLLPLHNTLEPPTATQILSTPRQTESTHSRQNPTSFSPTHNL